jgi:RNA polymerase sigma-70 factor, ECF subfamily
VDTGDAGLQRPPGVCTMAVSDVIAMQLKENLMIANRQSTWPKLSVISGRGYGQKTDAELVVLCQNKDEAAFEEIIKRHQRTVYSLLFKLAPDWSDTSDLAQEAFIRMWRGIDRLHNPKAFRSWLSQIVTNLFYDELRKRPRQLNTLSLDQSFESEDEQESPTRDVRDNAAGPDELCQSKELNRVVREAMASLPDQFRKAIVLRELEGLSYEEIAELTAADLGTVKSRISRARTKIQHLLTPYLNADEVQLAKTA